MNHRRFARLVGMALALSAAPLPVAEAAPAPGDLTLTTLSGRPDTVTGGDALLRVHVPRELSLNAVTITVNDRDVTGRFAADRRANTLTGLVTGLREGANQVTAVGGRTGPRADLTLVNHPVEGPVFSGPHQHPYACETTAFRVPVVGGDLGPPVDADCSIATRVDHFYRTTEGRFAPFPKGASTYPTDLATTTTSQGRQVPYVVRLETGTVNRAIYQTAVLHDPIREPDPSFTRRTAGWNGRAVFTLGGGCVNGWYRQGNRTGGVTDHFMLSQGYALMSSSLNVFGVNCSDLTAAETAMMVKERFIERFGPIAHLIGFGSSGGSYQAHQISDNYPGIFDGIIVGSSFPEVGFATVNVITDAWLLDHYFSTTETQWTDAQRRAVTGFLTYATAPNVAVGARRIDPRAYCGIVPAGQRYDPKTNPTGVRCGVYDHAVNVYGRDPETGFARRPLDNVGIQYGLRALQDGVITPEQFLDLNEHVGGFDADANLRAERSVGDRDAIRIAYQAGRLTNGGGGLADLPIIDYRAYRDDNPDGDIHLRYHTLSMRQRLEKANGTAANHVSLLEDARYGNFSTDSPLLRHAITQLDRWLTNLRADRSDDPGSVKLARARPAELRDVCNSRDADPVFIAQPLDRDPASECERRYPSASFPREVAGESVAADVVKCQLKDPDRTQYGVTWTDAQWQRLRRVFPVGVCDYAKPGVEQRAPIGSWLRFQAAAIP